VRRPGLARRLLLLCLLAGCRRATVVDHCAENPDDCLVCAQDADCSLQGNSCLPTVTCAHGQTGLAFVQIGCSEALTYAWPDAADCACVEDACAWVGD
jgi:hypothetical protein